MERLEIALNEFRAAMDVEGLTPHQQLAIFAQVSNLIQIVHDEAWSSAHHSVMTFIEKYRQS